MNKTENWVFWHRATKLMGMKFILLPPAKKKTWPSSHEVKRTQCDFKTHFKIAQELRQKI